MKKGFALLMAAALTVGAWSTAAVPATEVVKAETVVTKIDWHNYDLAMIPGESVMFQGESDDSDKVEVANENWTKEGDSNPTAYYDYEIGMYDTTPLEYGTYYYSITFVARDGYEFSEDTVVVQGQDHVDVLKTEATTVTLSSDRKRITFTNLAKLVLSESTGDAFIIDADSIKLSKNSFTYNGKVQKPTVIVKMKDGKDAGDFAEITYFTPDSKDVGSYSVQVYADNSARFSDGNSNRVLTYEILPKGTTVKKVKAAKKKLTVTLKKQAVQTTGYEIQLSTSKNFKKIAKTKKIKASKTSAAFTGLKAKTKYYIRVRTYKKVASAEVVSKWSSAVNKKTK